MGSAGGHEVTDPWALGKGRPEATRPPRAVPPRMERELALLDIGTLRALQRTAGNAAVAALVQRAKTAPDRLKELEGRRLVTRKIPTAATFKNKPKHPHKYTKSSYQGRHYYHATDAGNRTVKISGALVYTTAKRQPTRNVSYKRKSDVSGHLIAHSFGGPPKLTSNYVAMSRIINAAGGDWGKVEGYIRTRLKQSGIKIWMAVIPQYTGVSKRPSTIDIRLRFNRSPAVLHFSVPTP